MARETGIIDKINNPFTTKDWINQGRGLTGHRTKQLKSLINGHIENIKKLNPNEGSYPAFVAIRWGFAKIETDVLIGTEKWKKRELYDKFGLIKIPGKTGKVRLIAKDNAKEEALPPKSDADKKKNNYVNSGPILTAKDIDFIKQELENRRIILIGLAHNKQIPMDPLERKHIITYLEKHELPGKPKEKIILMKEFISSVLSKKPAAISYTVASD